MKILLPSLRSNEKQSKKSSSSIGSDCICYFQTLIIEAVRSSETSEIPWLRMKILLQSLGSNEKQSKKSSSNIYSQCICCLQTMNIEAVRSTETSENSEVSVENTASIFRVEWKAK
jgi:hypothetical protein